jgi:hypothetical protein
MPIIVAYPTGGVCTGHRLVANRTFAWQASPMYLDGPLEHPFGMAPSTFPQPRSFQAAAVQSLLATERDAHRRQRELVRASLFLCPGKTRSGQPRAA